jgi:hypothetical protein
MVADEDGLPKVGNTGRYLGARPAGKFRDFDEVARDGTVRPGTGGLSVSPPPIQHLPASKRPPTPEFPDGYGEDPIFELDTNELPDELRYRPAPEKPDKHGFIEQSRRMTFEKYQKTIQATRKPSYVFGNAALGRTLPLGLITGAYRGVKLRERAQTPASYRERLFSKKFSGGLPILLREPQSDGGRGGNAPPWITPTRCRCLSLRGFFRPIPRLSVRPVRSSSKLGVPLPLTL